MGSISQLDIEEMPTAKTCKGAAGGTVDCVRVRPTSPKDSKDQAPDETAPMDPEMRANQQEQAREPGVD